MKIRVNYNTDRTPTKTDIINRFIALCLIDENFQIFSKLLLHRSLASFSQQETY